MKRGGIPGNRVELSVKVIITFVVGFALAFAAGYYLSANASLQRALFYTNVGFHHQWLSNGMFKTPKSIRDDSH